jgi:hypothetical protein
VADALVGISRSSTIVLAYLMSWLELEFEAALKELALARQGVSPNSGFRMQLSLFEQSEKRKALIQQMRAAREANETLMKLHKEDLECLAKRRATHIKTANDYWTNTTEQDDDEEDDPTCE